MSAEDVVTSEDVAVPITLPFVGAADLRDYTPDEPEWLWRGYLAVGAVTLLAGKPKSGKSTLACALVDAMVAHADTFLGREIGDPLVIVYVSEEGPTTLAHKLPASNRVRVLTRDAAWPKPTWPALVAAAATEAHRLSTSLIIIDALSFWASFGPDQEKDAGAAQKVMDALTAATRDGITVLLIHHQRKAGGEDGDAVRGSGAIFGAVDMLVEIERCGEDAPPGHRRLVATGRWSGAPPVLVVDRDPEHAAWRVIGEAEDRGGSATLTMRDRVLRALPDEEPGSTERELGDLLDVDKRKFGTTLRALVKEDVVERSGDGVPGQPFRYRRTCPAEVSRASDTSGGMDVSNPVGGHIPVPVPPGTHRTRWSRLPLRAPSSTTTHQPRRTR